MDIWNYDLFFSFSHSLFLMTSCNQSFIALGIQLCKSLSSQHAAFTFIHLESETHLSLYVCVRYGRVRLYAQITASDRVLYRLLALEWFKIA